MTQTTRTIKPVSPPAPRKMTYEEFLRWDGDNRYAEWVDGEIVQMSPTSSRHQRVANFLFRAISEFVERKRLGEVFHETFQMKTGPGLSGRLPDILFVASRNLPRVKENYLEGPADLVVEVISPDDPERDTIRKFAEYEAGGVPEYWLINPMTNQASFYILDAEGRYKLSEPDTNGRYNSTVLAGLWIDINWLWKENSPTLLDVLKEWGLV
jgi:Uma2 family endonuclease